MMSGTEPRRHGSLDRLLHQQLVSTGKLAPEAARHLSRLQQFRQHADYTASYVFTELTASDELGAATTFCSAARALLVNEGWID
jgi:uncharacterized protein (UPF0332 family)